MGGGGGAPHTRGQRGVVTQAQSLFILGELQPRYQIFYFVADLIQTFHLYHLR